MNKWYITGSSNMMIDTDTDRVRTIQDNYTSINCCYIAPEDCELKFYNSKTDGPVSYNVKKGQIVITFYNQSMPNQIVILDSKKWKENIDWYNEDIQKTKEQWASSKENCEKCCSNKA